MNKENKELKIIQETELCILKKCLEIISHHNLRYFMLGGTLLGAIRHKGFIPWDDDVDIGMPRTDYEKFLEYAKNELSEPYCLESYIPKANYHQQYFAKVTDKRIIVRLLNSDFKTEVSVWVDVFPLDGVPEGKVRLWFWKTRGLYLAKMFTVSQARFLFDRHLPVNRAKTRTNLSIRIIQKTGLDRLLNRDRIWMKLDRHLKKNSYESSSSLINLCGHWHMKEMFSKEVYGEGTNYHFEDVDLLGPNDYDYVLRQMYGDYLVLPPKDKRSQHGIELV